MLDFNEIKISYKPPRNWLIIILGISVIFFSPVSSMLLKDIYWGNLSFKLSAYPHVYLYSFLSWEYWILRIIVSIIVYEYSSILLRRPLGFILLAIVSPPISLIIIGLMDYKIKDKRIKKIILDKRAYFKDLEGMSKSSAEKEFQKSVRTDIINVIKADKFISIKKKLNERNLLPEENDLQLDLLHKNIDLNLFENCEDNDVSICQACGAKYYAGTLFCPDCEIALNTKVKIS